MVALVEIKDDELIQYAFKEVKAELDAFRESINAQKYAELKAIEYQLASQPKSWFLIQKKQALEDEIKREAGPREQKKLEHLTREYHYFSPTKNRQPSEASLEEGSEILGDANLFFDTNQTLNDMTDASDHSRLIIALNLTAGIFPPLRALLVGLSGLYDLYQVGITHQKPEPTAVKMTTTVAIVGLSITALVCLPLAAILGTVAMGVGLIKEMYTYKDIRNNSRIEEKRAQHAKDNRQILFEKPNDVAICFREEFYRRKEKKHKAHVESFKSAIKGQEKGLMLSALSVVGGILLSVCPPAGIILLSVVLGAKLLPKLHQLGRWVMSKLMHAMMDTCSSTQVTSGSEQAPLLQKMPESSLAIVSRRMRFKPAVSSVAADTPTPSPAKSFEPVKRSVYVEHRVTRAKIF